MPVLDESMPITRANSIRLAIQAPTKSSSGNKPSPRCVIAVQVEVFKKDNAVCRSAIPEAPNLVSNTDNTQFLIANTTTASHYRVEPIVGEFSITVVWIESKISVFRIYNTGILFSPWVIRHKVLGRMEPALFQD